MERQAFDTFDQERLADRFSRFLRPGTYPNKNICSAQFLPGHDDRPNHPNRAHLMPLPAGVIGVPLLPFLVATLLGIVAWNLPLLGAGYLTQDPGFSPVVITLVAFALVACQALIGFWVFASKRSRHAP